MRFWVTRPEPDATALAEELRRLGHETHVAPLLQILPDGDAPLPGEGIAALAVTSRNALRAVAARSELASLRSLPLVAVGEATARLARELGFHEVIAGEGRAATLASLIQAHTAPEAGAVLHIRGDRLAHDLKGDLEAHGFRVCEPVLYRAVAVTQLAEATRQELAAGRLDGVILMSPRTAAVYADLVAAAGLAKEARMLLHLCLSEEVARALQRLGPASISIPPKPSREELLALVARAATHSR